MNEKRFNRISSWITSDNKRFIVFKYVYKGIPILVGILYILTLGMELISSQDNYETLIRMIFVPAVTFALCTIIRYLINEKRPYENFKIKPVIDKNTKGQSFPSRHMVSVTVITMTALYFDVRMGIVGVICTIIIGCVRPAAGVHYIKDVVAGIAFGVVCGIIGFWII